MLLTKTVKIKWRKDNKDIYENKGYKFTNYGKEFEINVNDLLTGSHKMVEILCDYCQKTVVEKSYKDYISQNLNSIIHKDCCKKCQPLKLVESNKNVYGVSFIGELESTIEKRRQTNLSRYGVENCHQTQECKDKIKQTNLLKFGFENPKQNQIIKDKAKLSSLLKYGVEYYSQTEESKIKFINTSMKNWGTKHPMQNINVRTRVAKTLFKNKTASCSLQQKYFHNLIKGELNYAVRNINLDIAFPEEMVYVEYDGGGHALNVKLGKITEQEFKNNERNRWYLLKSKGWREIRIISINDKLPLDEKILEMIEYAKEYLNTGHSWIKFDINNNKVINSQGEFDYDFGELRKIKHNPEQEDVEEVG